MYGVECIDCLWFMLVDNGSSMMCQFAETWRQETCWPHIGGNNEGLMIDGRKTSSPWLQHMPWLSPGLFVISIMCSNILKRWLSMGLEIQLLVLLQKRTLRTLHSKRKFNNYWFLNLRCRGHDETCRPHILYFILWIVLHNRHCRVHVQNSCHFWWWTAMKQRTANECFLGTRRVLSNQGSWFSWLTRMLRRPQTKQKLRKETSTMGHRPNIYSYEVPRSGMRERMMLNIEPDSRHRW